MKRIEELYQTCKNSARMRQNCIARTARKRFFWEVRTHFECTANTYCWHSLGYEIDCLWQWNPMHEKNINPSSTKLKCNNSCLLCPCNPQFLHPFAFFSSAWHFGNTTPQIRGPDTPHTSNPCVLNRGCPLSPQVLGIPPFQFNPRTTVIISCGMSAEEDCSLSPSAASTERSSSASSEIPAAAAAATAAAAAEGTAVTAGGSNSGRGKIKADGKKGPKSPLLTIGKSLLKRSKSLKQRMGEHEYQAYHNAV